MWQFDQVLCVVPSNRRETLWRVEFLPFFDESVPVFCGKVTGPHHGG